MFELGRKAVLLGMWMRQSIICKFVPRASMFPPDFRPVVPTMMKMRAKRSDKDLNQASSILRRAQSLLSVTTMMSQATLGGCMKTQKKLDIGMRAKVKME